MNPITAIFLTMLRSNIVKKAISKTVSTVSKSKLGRKVAKTELRRPKVVKKAIRKTKGKQIRLSSVQKLNKQIHKNIWEGWSTYDEYIVILHELDKAEKILSNIKKWKENYNKIKKIQATFYKFTRLDKTISNAFQDKVYKLIYGKSKPSKADLAITPSNIKKFEKRLLEFKKNSSDIRKFNKEYNDGNKDNVNICVGLDSSWLLWGYWVPIKGLTSFGNVTLRLNPAVTRSSKNPSLTYNYGINQKDPPMHISTWKKMSNEANAGTTYWRQYKKVFGLYDTRKEYYKGMRKKNKGK